MKRLLLITLLFLLVLVACTPQAAPPPAEPALPATVTVVDDMGRSITVPKNPARIVSLAPSNTEILYALGVFDRVVAVTDVCFYPAEAQTLPQAGSFFEPSVEAIVAFKPDVVFAASLHKEPVEQLDSLGIPVVVLNPQMLEDIIDNIIMVGEAVSATDKADELVLDIRTTFVSVQDKVKHLRAEDKPVVFWEVWSDPVWTAGKATFIHEMIEMSGGINMAADVEGTYVEYSFEMLLAKDPQVIFYGHAAESVEEYLGRPNWGSISAVKNGRVYLVDQDLVQQPGPRIGLGLIELARHIHPDLWK